MKTIKIVLCLVTAFTMSSTIVKAQLSQNKKAKIYKVNLAFDLPVTIIGGGLTAYGFKKINDKSGSSLVTVDALNYGEVSGFNRFFMKSPNYSTRASDLSDALFYGAFPVGFALFLDKNIRSDFATIALLYVETLAITGTIYSNLAANIDKYRPLAYPRSGAPEEDRTRDIAKASFPGGHPTITAAATFFTAKVIQDYYPYRKGLHVVAYSGATLLTMANVILRHQGGKHFASDLLFGLAYSIPIGILVPQLHKIDRVDDRLSFYTSGNGVTLAFIIK